MPYMTDGKRDYKKENKLYKSKPKQKKIRASRNKARHMLEKKGLVKKGDGKHVNHKDGNPLNNSRKNLGVLSAKKNTSFSKKNKNKSTWH